MLRQNPLFQINPLDISFHWVLSMSIKDFKLPKKPTIQLIDSADQGGVAPRTPGASEGARSRKFSQKKPRVSCAPPHTQFAVIPSRAITDPRINRRKPLLLSVPELMSVN